jgi:cell division protein FtsL
MTLGKFIYLLAVATAVALCVVRQNAALRATGYRVQDLREEVADQEGERATYQAHLSKLRNPQRIQSLVAWLGLDLCERSVATPVARTPDQDLNAPEPEP